MGSKKSAFIVEHDFIMATDLADKVICFEGTPAKECNCTAPESLITGMNKFLRLMDISFRRDPSNYRPRINKDQSRLDQEQKKAGNYFLMDVGKLTKEEEDEDKETKTSLKSEGKAEKGGAKGGGKGGKKGKDADN